MPFTIKRPQPNKEDLTTWTAAESTKRRLHSIRLQLPSCAKSAPLSPCKDNYKKVKHLNQIDQHLTTCTTIQHIKQDSASDICQARNTLFLDSETYVSQSPKATQTQTNPAVPSEATNQRRLGSDPMLRIQARLCLRTIFGFGEYNPPAE